jgi:SAM-dependent methyltransferase
VISQTLATNRATPVNPYSYPDPLDATTVSFISEHAASDGRWQESEDRVLSFAVERIAARFGGQARCLDAGAGTGRLTGRFGAVSATATALELDPSRFDREAMLQDAAERGFHLIPTVGNAIDMAELPEAPFDVVVLSHLIQHAPRAVAARIITAAARALEAGGFLYLTVPLSAEDQDEHILARVENARFVQDRITAADFDRLCLKSPDGWLPTRTFSVRALIGSLESADFRIDDVLAFHFKPERRAWPQAQCVLDTTRSRLGPAVDVALFATRE